MSNKVAITGANGFVGKVLCGELVNNGWMVKGLIRSESVIQKLPELVEPYVLDDLKNISDHPEVLEGCNSVVHLAAKVHDMNRGSLSDYRKINTQGTIKLAEAAVNAGVKKFIYISTIKVNGEETVRNPFSYDDVVAPEDPYAISKWEAECALLDLAKRTRLEVTIIRPVLVYGPRVKGNLLLLMKWIERGIPLPFAGIGNARSMINVYNLTDLIRYCLETPGSSGKVLLASDGDDVSTSELISVIARAMGKSPRLFRLPKFLTYLLMLALGKKAAYDRLFGSLVVDIQNTRKSLDWEPKYNLREGIQKMVDDFLGK